MNRWTKKKKKGTVSLANVTRIDKNNTTKSELSSKTEVHFIKLEKPNWQENFGIVFTFDLSYNFTVM